MKKIILLFTCVFFALNAMAVVFSDNGINYYILSANSVAVSQSVTPYSNTIIIPSKVTNLSTEYTVTSIHDSAFFNCKDLKSVTFPTSITSIGSRAFWGCSGLTSTPDLSHVDSIGYYSFFACTSLTSVSISNSNSIIGECSFYQCSGLVSAFINAKSIGNGSFAECAGLNSVTIGNNVTSVGADAFYCCYSLREFIVDDKNMNFTTIDGVLYSKDKTIVIVYPNEKGSTYIIPDGVDSIASFSFESCPNLKSILIPQSVKGIGESAFFGCTGLISVNIPISLSYIGMYAFYDCTGLESITLPPSLTVVESCAFQGCSSLTYVNMPSSLTQINPYAFSFCSKLKTIDIPSSVTYLGLQAFSNCSGLTSIYVHNVLPPVAKSHAFLGIPKSSCILNIPAGSRTAYQEAAEWKDFTTIVETVTGVPELSNESINLVPNPVTDGFYINYPEGIGSVTINDMNGRQLYTKSIKANEYIPLTTFSPGIYIVRIITLNGTFEKKIVKK